MNIINSLQRVHLEKISEVKIVVHIYIHSVHKKQTRLQSTKKKIHVFCIYKCDERRYRKDKALCVKVK